MAICTQYVYFFPVLSFHSVSRWNSCAPLPSLSHLADMLGHPKFDDCFGPGSIHCQHGSVECFANQIEVAVWCEFNRWKFYTKIIKNHENLGCEADLEQSVLARLIFGHILIFRCLDLFQMIFFLMIEARLTWFWIGFADYFNNLNMCILLGLCELALAQKSGNYLLGSVVD